MCECMDTRLYLSHLFFASVSLCACVSHRNTHVPTHSQTHTEHAMHFLRTPYWSRSAPFLPLHMHTCTHVSPGLWCHQGNMVIQDAHISSLASRATFLMVLHTFYSLRIQGWSVGLPWCLFRTDFTLCHQSVTYVIALYFCKSYMTIIFVSVPLQSKSVQNKSIKDGGHWQSWRWNTLKTCSFLVENWA